MDTILFIYDVVCFNQLQKKRLVVGNFSCLCGNANKFHKQRYYQTIFFSGKAL